MKTYKEKELKESFVALLDLFEDLFAYWSVSDLIEAVIEAKNR